MIKFKLDKNNKYKGKIDYINYKLCSVVKSKDFLLRFFSVFLALECSLLSIPFISKSNMRRKDMEYMYQNFYLDDEDVSDYSINYVDEYKQLEDKYNSMSDEEKREYVVYIFNTCIDNSDYFTEDEKKVLKEREGLFLSEYGHNYYFSNVFNMVSRLRRIKVNKEVDLRKGISGKYTSDDNTINIDIEHTSEVEVVGHELEHAITYNEDIEGYSYLYIREAMDSSTDLRYYNDIFYHKSMKNHMFFLSKIIGRDNLLKVYLNSDCELLKKLIGNDYDELMDLFEKEMIEVKTKGKTSVCSNDIANKLKEIYEKKNNCLIKDDEEMNIIYQASKYKSNFDISSTLFSNNIDYYEKVQGHCFDEARIMKLKYIYYNKKSYLKRDSSVNLKSAYNNKDVLGGYSIKKLEYFFADKVVKKIVDSSNPEVYLKMYLNEVGVSNTDYWTYVLLNDKIPIVCCKKIYDYDVKCFSNDLKIMLRDKYFSLKKEDKLYELCDSFDVFFNNARNVNRDTFYKFSEKVLTYEDDFDCEDAMNKSHNYYFRNRGK